MTGECARVLKQCTMTGVRIDDELCIGQMLAESERVDSRNHRVVVPIRDKYRLRDLFQISVRLAPRLCPLRHCCQLCSGGLSSSWRVLVPCPPCKPFDKSMSSRLARFRGFEKQLE